MRLFILFMVLLCISLSACKQNDKGDAQLPMEEEKIIDILIDMHYAGEASRITRGINHDSLLRVYTNQVLEIQKIDSTQLNNLMKYLESNLDTYYKIEQKVHLKIKELKENKKS